MNRTRSHWLLAALVAAAAAASVITALDSIRGFASSGSGDSPASMSGLSLAILAVGMLIILGLESSHQRRHRARRAGMARAGDLLAVRPASSRAG